MVGRIPWDVWVATFVAGAAALAEIFDPKPAIFVMIYLALCAYIAAETIGGELDGG